MNADRPSESFKTENAPVPTSGSAALQVQALIAERDTLRDALEVLAEMNWTGTPECEEASSYVRSVAKKALLEAGRDAAA